MKAGRTRVDGVARGFSTRYFAAFEERDYRIMWCANLAAGAAGWALVVARGWVVFDLSASSAWVGLVTFAAMAPRMLVTPLIGYLSDRFDRRAMVAVLLTVDLANNLVLGLLVLTGSVQIWHLVALAGVNGVARAGQMATAHALIPNLVPRRHLLNAVGLDQVTVHGSRLAGPAAIAPLLATTGPAGAFFLCAVLYALGVVLVMMVGTKSSGSVDRSRGMLSNLAAAVGYVYRTPVLLVLVGLAVLHCGLTMSFESLLPVLTTQRLNSGGAGFSYLMMGVGAGALVAVLGVAGLQREDSRGRLFLYLGLLSGVSPLLLAAAPNMGVALLGAAAMGASQAGFMTLVHTMIQTIVPDGVRGRVSAIYAVHVGGTMALANLANGTLADVLSAPLILSVGGMAFVGVMALSWRRTSLRGIYTRGLRMEPAVAGD